MKRLFWVENRFSWPFVIILAYISLSLLALDYVWRNLVMPFEALIIYAIATNATATLLAIGAYRVLRPRSRTRS